MLIAWLQIIGGLSCLVYGANQFINGAAQIARAMEIPPLIIGLTVVGIATSAPEILVGSIAAFDGNTNIAIGNAIGSNIANIGLVLGATAICSPLFIASETLRREYFIMFVTMLAALRLMLDLALNRMDATLLLLVLAGSIWWVIKISRQSAKADPLAKELAVEYKSQTPVGKSLFSLTIGLIILLVGAEYLVRGSVSVATSLGLSDLVIGLTIVAIGTSLPELAASITSVLKNESDIAIGNIIGSNMFNMLAVIGIPTLINPSRFGIDVIFRDFSIMYILTILIGCMVFLRKKGRIARYDGAVLLSCFILYQAWLFTDMSI